MKNFAFVFPGQGAQKVGMGKDFFVDNPASREMFENADRILGYSISEKIFNGPADELKKTEITQPAVFLASAACLAALKNKLPGIQPAYVAGHSLGEYTAVYASGALDFESALKLVAQRGRIMAKITGGGMAAIIGLEDDKVREICKNLVGVVEPVNFNSPGQIVIAGEKESIAKACEAAKAAGAKRALPLAVSGPFHSSLMKPAQDEFAEFIQSVEFTAANVPVVANCSAQPSTETGGIKQALLDQFVSPVMWVDSVKFMAGKGVDTFIEIGPGNIISGLIKRIMPGARTFSVGDAASLDSAVGELNRIVN